jgi:D-alanyl-D-alanine dipeptidase
MSVLARLFVILLCWSPAFAEGMPKRFVFLRDVDPSIAQAMLYAGDRNFTGRRLPGYDAAECVLVREAADALKAVQAELKPRGLSLLVYDCYRPARAVTAFVDWAKKPDDAEAKTIYYPQLSKRDLFPDYIATVSGHSHGATVDVALMPVNVPDGAEDANPVGCAGAKQNRGSDSVLDMGTGFDCFDRRANTFAPGLTSDQVQNRKLLLEAMQGHGFRNYEKEWWHYTLRNEPFPDTIFDFPILARPNPRP